MTHNLLDLEKVTPSLSFEESLIKLLDAKFHQMLQRKFFFNALISIVTLSLTLFGAVYLFESFVSSGFFDYVSLIISDHATVLSYLDEFGLSLVESLPVLALACVLGVVGVSVWSVSKTIRLKNIIWT